MKVADSERDICIEKSAQQSYLLVISLLSRAMLLSVERVRITFDIYMHRIDHHCRLYR